MATTFASALFCIPGITFFTAMLAAPSTPQRTGVVSLTRSLAAVEWYERHMMRRVDLAPICRDVRFSGPLVAALNEIHGVAPLLIAQHFRRRERKLALVIGTRCMGGPIRR